MDPAPTTLEPTHILNAKTGDGIIARTPEEAEAAEHMGYVKCHTPTCPFMLSPETVQRVASTTGYYTCSRCRKTYHLMNEWPPQGLGAAEAEENARAGFGKGISFNPGGGTINGQTLAEVGEAGERVVEGLGEIPGYGRITWWHHGGAASNSPLDGATEEWGIEVKSLNVIAKNHRFIAGGTRKWTPDGEPYNEIESKEAAAKELGKKGVLGVLVILNYYNSTADVYVKAMPLGKFGHFYTHTAEQLVAKDVPFKNTLLDPHSPEPVQNTEFQVPGGSF